MKTYSALLLLTLLLPVSGFSQSLTDIARSKSLIWYGVDFSIVRFIGFDYSELISIQINDWSFSNLSAEEENMIRRSYGKEHLENRAYNAYQRNTRIDCREAVSSYTYQISIDKIQQVVKEYPKGGDGYGVLLIVESIEKIQNSIFIWVIYIECSTGKIISSRRYIGGGYGGKNKNYSKEGVELIIKLSGKDLKLYK